MKPVYFILGASGSGRREVVFDLIDGGCNPDANIAVTVDEQEGEIEPKYNKLEFVKAYKHKAEGDQFITDAAVNESDGLFFISNGMADPSDEVERFKNWLEGTDYELGQILTVVHCELLSANSALENWYDACIHFSDSVLLNKRTDVEQSWVRNFLKKYEKECYPCQFEYVKNGRVKNPAALLDNIPRRISSIFEPSDIFDDLEIDGDDLPEEPFDLVEKADPYLERQSGGKRTKLLPDIKKYLQKQ